MFTFVSSLALICFHVINKKLWIPTICHNVSMHLSIIWCVHVINKKSLADNRHVNIEHYQSLRLPHTVISMDNSKQAVSFFNIIRTCEREKNMSRTVNHNPEEIINRKCEIIAIYSNITIIIHCRADQHEQSCFPTSCDL